jgi:hypothetical protein
VSACTLAMCFERQRRGATIEGQMRACVEERVESLARVVVSTVERKDTIRGWFCAPKRDREHSCGLCVCFRTLFMLCESERRGGV